MASPASREINFGVSICAMIAVEDYSDREVS
jgi:hypothetical protein